MNSLELTRGLIRNCLQLKASHPLKPDTPLLGAFPELNSLTIATLIMQIEELVDCEIADDEIRGEVFQTIGSLADFIDGKLAAA